MPKGSINVVVLAIGREVVVNGITEPPVGMVMFALPLKDTPLMVRAVAKTVA